MPHNQYMFTPLIMWLITARMHLPPGNGIFSPARKKLGHAYGVRWVRRKLYHTFSWCPCFWHFSGLRGVMSPGYCCFKSILCWSHYLMSLPIQEILPQSISNKASGNTKDIHWFFGDFCRPQSIKTWKCWANFFEFLFTSIHAIRYNRRQETVSMPKYGPLLLEFNTCEKSLWLGCRNFTQCFRVQFVFWPYYPWKAVCSNHYILIARYYCYLAENKCETPKTCFHLSHGKGHSMIRKIAIKTEIQKQVDFPEVCISDTLCDFSRVDLFPSLFFVNFSSVFFLKTLFVLSSRLHVPWLLIRCTPLCSVL